MNQTPVTIWDVAEFRGVKEENGSVSGAEFERVGLPLMGGCECCHSSIAAYNAFPSKSGFIRCADCIGNAGWYDVAQASHEIGGHR